MGLADQLKKYKEGEMKRYSFPPNGAGTKWWPQYIYWGTQLTQDSIQCTFQVQNPRTMLSSYPLGSRERPRLAFDRSIPLSAGTRSWNPIDILISLYSLPANSVCAAISGPSASPTHHSGRPLDVGGEEWRGSAANKHIISH